MRLRQEPQGPTVLWLLGLLASVAGLMLAAVETASDFTRTDDVASLAMLVAMYLASLAANVSVIGLLPAGLRFALTQVASNRRASAAYVAIWTALASTGVTTLAVYRDAVAELLSSDVIRHYPATDAACRHSPESYIGRSAWLERWHTGEVLAGEIGFAVMAILVVVGVGYFAGRRSRSLGVVLVVLPLLLIGHVLIQGFIVNDYDMFLGGVYSDALLMTLALPMFPHPTLAGVAMLVFAGFYGGGLAASALGAMGAAQDAGSENARNQAPHN